MITVRLLRSAAACALVASSALHAAVTLPALKVDTSQTTVSGLSSGGFMANQLGYAYSATFKGVGVFAGGPYMCAGHSNYTACMYNATISASMLSTMQADINNWSATAIDDKARIASQKIYLFVGNSDYTVGPNPMNAVQAQYTNNGVAAANLEYIKRDSTAHTSTSDNGAWDSALLAPGASFSRTFQTAGTFPYHCTIHPNMVGTVTVQ
jgi:plastocyanin